MDSLLLCPLCHRQLRNPTTLHCGHSLCSVHLEAPTSSCPVNPCSSTPSGPQLPPNSSVRFTPAANPPIPITTHRSDVVLNKIIALVNRQNDPLLDQDSNDDDGDNDLLENSPRPRKRLKQSHHDNDDDDDDDDDLLSHLRAATVYQRETPSHIPLDLSSTSSIDEFDKKLLEELTCHICYVLFYQPVTTPCQHTFCAKCLQRSLDHNHTCPVCRTELPSYYFQDQPINKTVLAIILKAFPSLYQERGAAIEEEESHARLNTPIFVCTLSFPGVPTWLHLFEPRYRLMLRRCLESPNPRFGMVMSQKQGAPQVDYGTMLEIRSVQMLPDGRSYVETWGSSRFRILERGTLDGYMVARIERIFDYPDDITETLVFDDSVPVPRQVEPTNAELMQICRAFLDRLQRGAAPWVVQRLSSQYGAMPTDPALFAFWVALILPIEEQEKAKLLPIRSARLRLMLVVHWIEQLNNNWYAWLSLFVLRPLEGWLLEGPGQLLLLALCVLVWGMIYNWLWC